MFATSLRGGKAFAAERKIMQLKGRIPNLKTILDKTRAKILAVTIIKTKSAENMNDVKSEKYGISPNGIKKNSPI